MPRFFSQQVKHFWRAQLNWEYFFRTRRREHFMLRNGILTAEWGVIHSLRERGKEDWLASIDSSTSPSTPLGTHSMVPTSMSLFGLFLHFLSAYPDCTFNVNSAEKTPFPWSPTWSSCLAVRASPKFQTIYLKLLVAFSGFFFPTVPNTLPKLHKRVSINTCWKREGGKGREDIKRKNIFRTERSWERMDWLTTPCKDS